MSSVRAYISTNRVRRNTERLQELADPAELMAVIKADAYGHGAVKIADVLTSCGIKEVAVARIPEAIQLRDAGYRGKILVFAAPRRDEWSAYDQYDLDATVPSLDHAIELSRLDDISGPLRVHIKVETGMQRLGMPAADVPEAVGMLRSSPHVTVVGIWTHLAAAGSTTQEGQAFTKTQLKRFENAVSEVDDPPPALHVSSSTAIIRRLSDNLRYQPAFARPGLSLFGIGETEEIATAAELEPVMMIVADIVQVKRVPAETPVSYSGTWRTPHDCMVAVVGAGYADGYPRLLSNRGEVTIEQNRYPVVGNVCMDMFMVNLGRPRSVPPTIQRGSKAVLFGFGGPSIYEVATWADTIPYEICSRISARVPRAYVSEFDDIVNI